MKEKRMTESVERTAPLHASLFSGVGGIDLGAERAGFRTAWTAEIDEKARGVLRLRFPDADQEEDVRDVGEEKQRPTLLSGGFPCQDLSVAGKRAGLAGDRSGLWFEFRRVIAETTPPWVLIENVPGLLSSNDGEDFSVLLEGLAGWRPEVPEGGWRNAGWITSPFPRLYGAVWRVLDTQYFGVPQRRRRVFVVARLGGVCPPEVLLEPDRLPWHPDPSREEGEVVPSEAGGGSEGGGGERGRERGGLTLGFDWQQAADHDEEVSATLSTTRKQAVLRSGPEADEEPGGFYEGSGTRTPGFRPGTSPTLKAGGTVAVAGQDPGEDAGDQDSAVVVDMGAGKGGAGVSEEESPTPSTAGPYAILPRYGGFSPTGYQGDACVGPGDVARTVPAQGGNLGGGPAQIYVAARPRRLTPRETERLQGFPDDWTLEGVDDDGEEVENADTRRYRMTGNAVSVPVAEWICRRILACHRDEDPDEATAGLPARYWLTVSEEWRREKEAS